MQYSPNKPVTDDSERLRFARFLADLLDQRFTIPGTSIRIGLDPIISLIPGIGDLLANLTGSLILLVAAQLGVSKIVIARMAVNIALNTLLGAIPIFGDIVSIWFRSNVRNVDLLQQYLGRPTRRATFADWLLVIGLIVLLLVFLALIVLFGIWLFQQLWNALQGRA
jgi:hypothetical protein